MGVRDREKLRQQESALMYNNKRILVDDEEVKRESEALRKQKASQSAAAVQNSTPSLNIVRTSNPANSVKPVTENMDYTYYKVTGNVLPQAKTARELQDEVNSFVRNSNNNALIAQKYYNDPSKYSNITMSGMQNFYDNKAYSDFQYKQLRANLLKNSETNGATWTQRALKAIEDSQKLQNDVNDYMKQGEKAYYIEGYYKKNPDKRINQNAENYAHLIKQNEYDKLRNNSDFVENSKEFNRDKGGYRNMPMSAGEWFDYARESMMLPVQAGYATEEQLATMKYIYNTQGYEKMKEYYDFISSDLNRKATEDAAGYTAGLTMQHPVAANVLSLGLGVASGIGYMDDTVNTLRGKPIDQNNIYHLPANMKSAIQSTTEENHIDSKAGKFLYNTGMSIGDFAVAAGVSYFTGTPQVATALLSTSAATNTVIEAKNRGLSDSQAYTLGTVSGAAEYVSEKISIDRLFDTLISGKATVAEIVKQMAAEGSEEVFSSSVNLIADIVVAKDRSQWELAIAEYEMQGMSREEAVKHALRDEAGNLALDFAGGAISGGVMGGGAVAYNNTINNRYNKAVGNQLMANNQNQAVFDLAKGLDYNSKANEYAYSANPEKPKQVGKLYNISQSQAEAEVKNKANEIIAQRLSDLGEDANVIPGVANAVKKAVYNEQLNEQEYGMLSSSKNARKVFNEFRDALSGRESAIRHESIDRRNNLLSALTTKNIDNSVTINSTEEKTKVSGVKSIDEEGVVTYNLENGETATSEELSFDNEFTAQLNESASKYGPVGADAFIKMYGGEDAVEYSQAFDALFRQGKNDPDGKLKADVMNTPVAQLLNPSQSEAAYEAGRVYAQNLSAEPQEELSDEPEYVRRIKNIAQRAPHKTIGNVNIANIRTKSLTPKQNASIKVMSEISKVTGGTLKMVAFESKADLDGQIRESNGWYDSSTNTIYFDINAGIDNVYRQGELDRAILRTGSHELTHFVQNMSPEYYAGLKGFIVDSLNSADPNGAETLVAAKMNSLNLTYDEALDEVIADSCEMLLRDSKAVQKLARENMTLAQKIKAWIDDFVKNIKKAFEGVSAKSQEAVILEQILGDMTELQNMWDKALEDALRTSKGTANGTQTENTVDNGKSEVYSKRSETENKYKKKKTPYDEFNSNVMQWSNSAGTQEGDTKIFCKNGRDFRLLEADGNGGFVELARGNYRKVAELYDEIEEEVNRIRKDIRSNSGKNGIEHGRNSRNSVIYEDGLNDGRNNRQTSGTKLQSDTSGNNEHNRTGDKGKSVKFSDRAYLDAVESGDMETAQRMVEKTARSKEYNSPVLYHGTHSFGFTHFDLDKMDDKRSIFLTNSKEIASTYSGVTGSKKIGKGNTENVSNMSAEEIVKKLNEFDAEFKKGTTEGAHNYELYDFKKTNNLINKVNDGIEKMKGIVAEEIKNYTDRMAVDFDEKDAKIHSQLVALAERLDRYDYENLSTPIYLLLHHTDVFNGNAEIAKLEKNIRLMNQVRRKDLNSGVIVDEALGGYVIEVMEIDQARDYLENRLKSGNYSLYAKLGKSLVIDGKGALWKDIRNWSQSLAVNPSDVSVVKKGDFYELVDNETQEVIENASYGINTFTQELYNTNKAKLRALMVNNANSILRINTEALNTTRDIAKFAKEHGYDSVVFKEIVDNGGWNSEVDYNEIADIYVIFDENSVKSADAITYDDNGNIIPLSKRFDKDNTDIRFSQRNYSYDALVSKPDMKITVVDDTKKYKPSKETRNHITNEAIKNAASVGYTNENGNAVVYVDDIETDVIVSKTSIRHGLDRRLSDNAPASLKVGEILKNAIRINEMTPQIQTADKSYVLIGVAKNSSGELSIVRFVVNSFSNELESIDNLYALNTKKESAVLNAPTPANNSLRITDSEISISDLLDYVNKHFPDILPEDVLKHYGHTERPEGSLGEDILFSHRSTQFENEGEEDTSNFTHRELLKNALSTVAQNDTERDFLARYQREIKDVEKKYEEVAKLRRQIHDISFTKGSDRSQLPAIKNRVAILEDQIQRADKKLLQLEATKALKDVVEREKKTAVKKANERNKQTFERYKSRKRSSEVREKIKKLHKKIVKSLLYPTDNNYIPSDLAKSMIDVCMAIDFSTDRTGPDGGKTKAQEKRESITKALKKLKDHYEELEESKDDLLKDAYDIEIRNELRELVKTSKVSRIGEMSETQLNAIYQSLKSIYGTLLDAKKMIGIEEGRTISEIGLGIIEEQRQIDRKKKGVQKLGQKYSDLIAWNTVSPMRNILRISGYDKNSELYQLAEQLNEGQRKKDIFVMESHKMFEHLIDGKENKKKYQDAIEKAHDFGIVDVDGNAVEMSKMTAMQLVMSWEREMASDGKHSHLQQSGAIIPNHKLLMDGKVSEAVSAEHAQRIDVDATLINDIVDQLDEWDKEYMEVAHKFFDEKSKNALNETSRVVSHRDVALSEKYIPYKVDDDFVFKKEISDENHIRPTLISMGMLKDTVRNAGQPLVMTSLNHVLDTQIEQVGAYYGLAIPVRNFNKIWNFMSDNRISVRESITKNWGFRGTLVIDDTIRDLQASRPNDNGKFRSFDIATSAFVRSVLNSNISVTLKQLSALPSAYSVLNQRFNGAVYGQFLKMCVPSKYNETIKEIDKYTAAHWLRRQGLSSQELGEIAKSMGKMKRFNDWLPAVINPTKWIQGMDCIVTASFWDMCKTDVRKQGEFEEGSEEFMQAVADLYNRVIEDTQAVYDTLHRPEVLRTTHWGVRQVFMFRSESLQHSGILYEKYGAMLANKNKETVRDFAKTAYAQYSSAMLFAILSLVGPGLLHKMNPYRDEDEELTPESVFAELLNDFTNAIFDLLIPIGGAQIQELIYGKISKNKFLDGKLSVPTIDFVNEFIGSASDLEDKLLSEEPEGNEILKAVENLTFKFVSLFGIPADNLKNIIKTFKLHIEDAVNGEFGSFEAGVDRSDTVNYHRATEALVEGDMQKYNDVIAELNENGVQNDKIQQGIRNQLKDFYLEGRITDKQAIEFLAKYGGDDDENDAYFTVKSWNEPSGSFSVYGDLREAITLGGDIDSTINDLVSHGKDESDVKVEIKKTIKKLYISDQISDQDAIDLLKMYHEMDDYEIYWQFREWDYYKNNPTAESGSYRKYGSLYEVVNEGGDADIAGTVKMYMDNGVSKKSIGDELTSKYKKKYIELYHTDKTAAADLKNSLLRAYYAAGYNWNNKSKDINDWLKDS